MANITQKSVVTMQLSGTAAHHARTDISVRDQSFAIDEPEERGRKGDHDPARRCDPEPT